MILVLLLAGCAAATSGNSWTQKWYDSTHSSNVAESDRGVLWSQPWLTWAASVSSPAAASREAPPTLADKIDQATVSSSGVAYYIRDGTVLVAADVATGRTLREANNSGYGPFASVPVLHAAQGVVLVVEGDQSTGGGHSLLCYDAATLAYVSSKTFEGGYVGSPLVEPSEGYVVVAVAAGASGPVTVYALELSYSDSSSCVRNVKWQVPLPAGSMSVGPATDSRLGVVYAVTQSAAQSQLHAVNAGRLAWTVTLAQPVAAPFVLVRPDGVVLVSDASSRQTFLFDPADGASRDPLAYQVFAASGDSSMLASDLFNNIVRLNASGSVLWSAISPSAQRVTAVSLDGSRVAYVTRGDAQTTALHAFDVETGGLLWAEDFGDSDGGAAVIVGDGTLLLHTAHALSRLGCCSGNGVCSGPGRCDCVADYYGAACDVYCRNDTNCSGTGYCQPDGSCECDFDYYGSNCSVYCSANATCGGGNWMCNTTGDGCQCDDDWYGSNCTIFCSDNETCSGHGQCGDDGLCTCDTDWFGVDCQASAINMNTVYIVAGVLAGVAFLCIVFTLVACIRRSRRFAYVSIQE